MQTTKFHKHHIVSPKIIVIVWDHGQPTSILSGNARFEEIKQLIEDGRFSELPQVVDMALAIEAKTKGKFLVVNGVVEIDGEQLPNALSDKLLELVEENYPTEPLERFWDNLRENPTESAREDLFSFLEANQVPLTADGCFIAYKKVMDNYFDSYTGKTYLNTPGSEVSMPREQVDADRRNTCSRGLHVAAWGYANGFSGTRTMIIKINPRDVVAVPPDYDQQKMRVCRYTVVCETDSPYARTIYEMAENG